MDEQQSARFLEEHPELRLTPEFIRDFERDCDADRVPHDRLARARRQAMEAGVSLKPKR